MPFPSEGEDYREGHGEWSLGMASSQWRRRTTDLYLEQRRWVESRRHEEKERRERVEERELKGGDHK